jgi:RimJ/RimL family protein N-acetyltransferase
VTWHPVTDGVVTIRPFVVGDRDALLAGRDAEAVRWLGQGSEAPSPSACIEAQGNLVGWIDADVDQPWLEPGEVNVGYGVFPEFRQRRIAFRSLQLFVHHLAWRTDVRVVTVLIDDGNAASLRVVGRAGFVRAPARPYQPTGQRFLSRPVPNRRPSAGAISLRPLAPTDLEADLGAKDAEQMRWMWLAWHIEHWHSMDDEQRRAHALQGLIAAADDFGNGPKWRFAGDTPEQSYVVYVDCDLANDKVPAGEANISYSTHPAHRRRGYATLAVRATVRFLRDNTGAEFAHILADERNAASLGVARAVGARPVGHVRDEEGHLLVRHAIALRESDEEDSSAVVRPGARA